VLAEEITLLEMVQAGRRLHEEIGRGGKWSFLSPLVEANPEQKNAVLEILRSKDLMTSVRGPAGSGKTSMMQEAVKAAEALSGREVLVFAPSSSAVKVLKQEGFLVSDTFQRLVESELLWDVGARQNLADRRSRVCFNQANALGCGFCPSKRLPADSVRGHQPASPCFT
jgi:hypothetical protein